MTATVRSLGRPSRITQLRVEGVAVIRPVGALDRALADDIRRCSPDGNAPVVIDLTDCVLTDTSFLRRGAIEGQFRRPHTCIVSPRPTARRLLRRSGLARHVPVFRSVQEAMEERAWRPENGH